MLMGLELLRLDTIILFLERIQSLWAEVTQQVEFIQQQWVMTQQQVIMPQQ